MNVDLPLKVGNLLTSMCNMKPLMNETKQVTLLTLLHMNFWTDRHFGYIGQS